MAAALALLSKLLPLYITVGLGWLAGRYLQASGKHIAGIMLYMVTPAVIFAGVMNAPLSPSVVLLPLLVYSFCTLVALLHLWVARRWLNEAANMIPLTVGTGNTGYFGIPVALLLFGEEGVGLYIVCMLGTTLFENSLGFYLAARGRFGVRDCLLKVIRLPSLYAFCLGVTLNFAEIGIPAIMQPLFDNLRGTYSILGMMIIGMSILSLQGLAGDVRFTLLAFIGKFVAWPLVAVTFWWVDSNWLGVYDPAIHRSLFLVSITPIAANTVVIATLLDTSPRQVAGTALLSTVFALLYIPLMVSLFVS